MLTYILWTISNIQGPGGEVVLRFTNVAGGYVIDSGPDVGESFQDSWTEASVSRFAIRRVGHSITQGGLLSVGGRVAPVPTEIEVANNYENAQSTVRQLDYLFSSTYDLSNAAVVGELKDSIDGSAPTYSSFSSMFTGTLARRPTKSIDTVTFHLAPTMADTDGPMLTARHTGMGSYYLFQSVTAPTEANPPSIVAADFSLQFYGAFVLAVAATGNQSLYKVEDPSNVPLIDLYIDTSERLKLGVKYATGTDVYTLWTRPASEQGIYDSFWASISWDQTGGTMSAWVNGTKVVDATAILNTPTGTEDHNVFADINSTSIALISAVRVYGSALSEAEILRREGPLDYAEDAEVLNAWEFNDGVGDICTDYGPDSRHVALPSGFWNFRQLDGDRWQDENIAPLVLGSAFGVPVSLVNPKEPSGIVSVTGSYIMRAYSKGVPLSTSNFFTGSMSFDHLTGSIKKTTGVFGREFVPGETIEVESAFDSQYDGTYVIESVVPNITGSLKPSGTTDLFSVIVESHSWTSSGTGSATVKTADIAATNWFGSSLEESPYTGSTDVLGIVYNWSSSGPLTADVIGDDDIFPASPPAGYVNPDTLTNVMLQALKTYGPQWDNTTLPVLPYVFSDFPSRVGYYIPDAKSAGEVVDDLGRGCLVWIEEGGDGVISLSSFAFPEDVGSSEEIFADDVVPSSVVTHRFSESARRDISSPWVTSLITQYARNWSPLQESDVPEVVDPEVRSFVTREWREVISGDAGKVTTDTPRFQTYENRKAESKDLGDAMLRLAQGEVAELAVRMDPEDQLTSYAIGAKVTGDLSVFGLGDVDRIVIGREEAIGAGLLRLSLWYEPD